MLSQTVEYALRAVVYLAMHSPDPQTTAAIAKATQVPTAYLAKVLQGLRAKDIPRLFTVETFYNMVIKMQAEKGT